MHLLPVGHLCIHPFTGCICCYALAAVSSTHKTPCIQRTSTKRCMKVVCLRLYLTNPVILYTTASAVCSVQAALQLLPSDASAAKQHICYYAMQLLPSNATPAKQRYSCQATQLLPSDTTAAKRHNCCQAMQLLPSSATAAKQCICCQASVAKQDICCCACGAYPYLYVGAGATRRWSTLVSWST